jgi:high-affinity nickel permease
MAGGLAILAIGFVLGIRHATDPDHVIAVSTFVSRERSLAKAGLIGIYWGIGHTLTITVVGAAIIVFGLVIPARVGLTMEFCVGMMLILLGILNLTGIMSWVSQKFSPVHPRVTGEHAHVHVHEGKMHLHRHTHAPGVAEHHKEGLNPPRWIQRAFAGMGIYHTLRPFFVGIVHGLAGSAAIALLVLSTIQQPRWGVLYLLIFGFGTIIGMMLITGAIALPFSFAGHKFAWLNRGLVTGSGLISLAFGLFVCYQIGFVDGLFTRAPHWNPN